MNATMPDPHPDSVPQEPTEAPDQLSPPNEPGRESVEDVPEETSDAVDGEIHDGSPLEGAGTSGGTAGTGGENKVQDSRFER